MQQDFINSFKENARFRIDENTRMLCIALSKIKEKQFWEKPNAISNSLGNQLLHLNGNLSQYMISALGEQADTRQRDFEFSAQNGKDKTVLLNNLMDTLGKAKEVLQNCSVEQLIKKYYVQGFELSGVGIVLHAVEHYSYHVGQIAFWIKQLTSEPLGFYDGIDLTVKNTQKRC